MTASSVGGGCENADLGAELEELLHQACVEGLGGVVEGRTAALTVRHIDGGARLDEACHQVAVVQQHRLVERRQTFNTNMLNIEN